MFVDEDNGDVDNIPSDGEGLDGNDDTSDESEDDSDVGASFISCFATAPCPSGQFVVKQRWGDILFAAGMWR